MGYQPSAVRAFAATALCLISAATHAQITKCIDKQGEVAYSDTACSDAVTIINLPTESDTPSQTGSAAPKLMSRMIRDDAPIKPTAWATMPVQQRHRSTDAVTVGQARQALAESDNAMASKRAMKLASSH